MPVDSCPPKKGGVEVQRACHVRGGHEYSHDGLPFGDLGAHLLDVLDVGVGGERLAVHDLIEARRRGRLHKQPRLAGRACEAPVHGALEAFASRGVFRHGCPCDVLWCITAYDVDSQDSLVFGERVLRGYK